MLPVVPRANRYILPGHIYHLTHRCHDRRFLLRFAKDRNGYRRRLREAVKQNRLSLLDYMITSNHVHLIVYADDPEQVARVVQQSAGVFARDYNRRKGRRGAYWEGRYWATIVEGELYLWRCLRYVELNMVRCGVAKHPGEWRWSGFDELMGWRKRNRLLDVDRLLWLLRCRDLQEFRIQLKASINEAIEKDELERQAEWTEAVAIGSRQFVQPIEALELRSGFRRGIETSEARSGWIVREEYEGLSPPQKQPMIGI